MSCLLRPSVPSALARPARPTLTRPRPFFAYGLKRKEWKKGRGAGGGEGNLAALSSLPFFVPPSESTLAAISGSLPCPSEPSSLPPRRRSAESSGARERATESTLRKLPFRSLAPHSPERRRPHGLHASALQVPTIPPPLHNYPPSESEGGGGGGLSGLRKTRGGGRINCGGIGPLLPLFL